MHDYLQSAMRRECSDAVMSARFPSILGPSTGMVFSYSTDPLHPDTLFLVGRTVPCSAPNFNVPFWQDPVVEDRGALVEMDCNSQQAMRTVALVYLDAMH